MKYFSFQKINIRFVKCFLIYLVCSIICRSIETLYFPTLKNDSINIALSIIMENGSSILIIIFELKKLKKKLRKKKRKK